MKGIIALVMVGRMRRRIAHQMTGQGKKKRKFETVKLVVDDQKKTKMLEDANVMMVVQTRKKSLLSRGKKENGVIFGVPLKRNAP